MEFGWGQVHTAAWLFQHVGWKDVPSPAALLLAPWSHVRRRRVGICGLCCWAVRLPLGQQHAASTVVSLSVAVKLLKPHCSHDCLGCSGSLCFRTSLSISTPKPPGIMIGICRIFSLIVFSFTVYRHGLSFCVGLSQQCFAVFRVEVLGVFR